MEANKMVKIQKSENNNYPEPSEKIQKTKARLQAKLNEQDAKITPSALKRILASIHDRIARLATERVVVRKQISLFDNNATSANTSLKVSNFAKELHKQNSGLYSHLKNVAPSLKQHIISES
jgi:multidrug resistance efflux pump